VVALNMIDVAQAQGVRVDAARLEKQLGVPVVPIQANKGRGLDRLREVVADEALRHTHGTPRPCVGFPEAFEHEVQTLRGALGEESCPFLVRRLLLDVGGYTEARVESEHPEIGSLVQSARQRLTAAGCGVPGIEARARYGWLRKALEGCVARPA